MEVRVQERIGAVEIEEADAEVVKGGEDGERADGLDDQLFECVDEIDLIDTSGVIVAETTRPAAVADDQIDGFELRCVATLSRDFDGVFE